MIKWSRWTKPELPWLAEGDIPADPVCNLDTRDNKISVWKLDKGASNLPRVVSALASARKTLDKFEYASFDQQVLPKIGIEMQQSTGDSCDERLNTLCHFDLVEISATKVVALAKAILQENQVHRVPWKEVARHITGAIEKGWLDKNSIKPDLIERAQGVVEREGIREESDDDRRA
jgi:hypothetical protein